ncbi:Pam17-domain-containing protein [Saccharata proteae CBS 121410]|uniref:Presequence translocated-associated motor subunit PAM17 n=1 Tax=Saccharata proteae CBS 121410 TaxID=1314787 RepID=A0A9P4LZ91_9PEZI|nr:Pam17-domain-containing protein [Saccharata proteae CBS 121410]
MVFRSRTSAPPCVGRISVTQALTRSASTSSPSTSRPATTPAPASSPPKTAPAQQPTETLTWNRYLALRKTRRLLGLIASGITAVAGTAAGGWLLATQNLDAIGAQTLGLDPLIVMVLGAFSCGGVGWLMGPTLGNGVFALMYRGLGRQVADKEREFYARLKKYRVDPTSSSLANPVPDYYGEKIGSVANYRRWLKDQRAFNLKVSGKPRVSRSS